MAFWTWASETLYPAGSNAWNSQPLAVAPAQDYWTPGVKPPAENLNYVFQQIGNGLTTSVSSGAAMKALPVPIGHQTVQLTPENNGYFYPYLLNGTPIPGGGSSGVGFGGIYYYDAAYTGPDNGSTCIAPTAVGSGPGRWRLTGQALSTVAETYYDATYAIISANRVSPGIATLLSTPSSYFNMSTAVSQSPNGLYLGDVIDMEACGVISNQASSVQLWFAIGSSMASLATFGFSQIQTNLTTPSGLVSGGMPFSLFNRYTIAAGDIAGGSFYAALQLNQVGSGTSSAQIQALKFTVRRP